MRKLQEFKDELAIIIRGTKLINEYLGRGYLFFKTVISTLRILTPYISIYFSGKIITALTMNSEFSLLVIYVLLAVGSTLVLDLISRIVNRKCLIMLNSCWFKHEALLSRKSLSLDYGKAESAAVSALRAKVSENARSNGAGVIWLAESIGTIISDVFSVIVAIAMISGMFIARSGNPLSGLLKFADSSALSVILGVLSVLLIAFTVKANNMKTKQVFEAYNHSSRMDPVLDYYTEKVLNENQSGKDIRIFKEKALILGEIERTVIKPLKESRNMIFRSNTTHGAVPVIASALLGGLVYIFVGLKALAGAFGAGKVVEYYGAITKLLTTVSSLASELGYIKSNNLYLRQELEYLDLTSDMKNGTKTLDNIVIDNLEFEFHNVCFKYPDTDVFVIKNLSMRIKAGERLAVVGMNGSGKTTMIKLLCRLYDTTSGSIPLNGINIKEFDYIEYLKLFAIVFQDFKLLAFPVGENIAGNEEYDESRVWECLEMAGIKKRVEELPLQLKQSIYKLYEKDGIDISGGEEQKLAIARALYKDAPFVILDEPTAALDPIAESEIYSKFNDIIGKKTAVYISHRLSSCRFCSRIIVFKDGTIIQEGTHDELLRSNNGKYFELWNAQAKYYNSQLG